MENYTRKSIFERLKGHCTFAGPNDYIEITEWSNGEGFDVDISSKLSTRFQLTWGEWEALSKMIKHIEEEDNEPTESRNPKFNR